MQEEGKVWKEKRVFRTDIFSRKIFLKIYVVVDGENFVNIAKRDILRRTSGSAKRVKLHYIKNTTRSKIIKFLLIILSRH